MKDAYLLPFWSMAPLSGWHEKLKAFLFCNILISNTKHPHGIVSCYCKSFDGPWLIVMVETLPVMVETLLQ